MKSDSDIQWGRVARAFWRSWLWSIAVGIITGWTLGHAIKDWVR